VLKKQISELSKELEALREQSAKPSTSYARPEDLNRLAEAVKEVDRKRMDDAEKTHAELLKLRKVLEAPLTSTKKGSGPKRQRTLPLPQPRRRPTRALNTSLSPATRWRPLCRRTRRRISR